MQKHLIGILLAAINDYNSGKMVPEEIFPRLASIATQAMHDLNIEITPENILDLIVDGVYYFAGTGTIQDWRNT